MKSCDIHKQVDNYFTNLYASEGYEVNQNYLQGIPLTIIDEMNCTLTREFEQKRLKTQMFLSIVINTGPDGMNSEFCRYH